MSFSINTNILATLTAQNLSSYRARMQQNYERLSSGYRINSALDDPAGMAMSKRLESEISSYMVAERSASVGVSMAQVATETLGEVSSLIGRMRDLAVQASNSALTSTDRSSLNTEYTSLRSEIDRLTDNTKFNGTTLLEGTAADVSYQVGIGTAASDRIQFALSSVDTNTAALAIETSAVDTSANAQTAITSLDAAIATVSAHRASFAGLIGRLESAVAGNQAMRAALTRANTSIRDVDVAEEASLLSRNQIFAQAGAALLAQANRQMSWVLQLYKF